MVLKYFYFYLFGDVRKVIIIGKEGFINLEWVFNSKIFIMLSVCNL